MDCKYKRVLLKISGEALAGESGHGLNEEIISKISQVIKNINDNYNRKIFIYTCLYCRYFKNSIKSEEIL